jgi:hypothetical protein
MKIFGKTLSEYLRFMGMCLALVAAVGLLRLVLSLAGVPNSSVKWLSVSWAGLLAIAYWAVRVHTTGFGGYRHLLPIALIQSVVIQGIIIGAIALGIFTGQNNIYTAPEYSVDPSTGASGIEGKTWGHAGGHAFFGLVVGTLIAWGIACLILLIAKKAAPQKGPTTASA